MGVETLVGLGLSAAGAGLNAKNQHDALKKQQDTAAAGLIQQTADQNKANAAVNQEVQKVAGSAPDAARQASLDAFLTQLQQSRAQAEGGGPSVNGGKRYNADKAAANADTAKFGTDTAGILSRIIAPGMQRQNEAQDRAQLGSDIGTIGRQSQADQFLEQLRQSTIQPSPLGSAAANTLSGIGAGLTSNAGFNPPKIKTPKAYGGTGAGMGLDSSGAVYG